MQQSESINELATALSKAQGEITGALKDSANPFFKSKFADLASCWDACRGPLSKNGLSVTQHPMTENNPMTGVTATYLVTSLLHSSGQWMRSSLIVQPKDDTPQAMGSALSYARRYMLCPIVGVAQVDDDGNAASGRADHDDKPEQIIPVDVARTHALAMLAILQAPAKDGDHDERAKALSALDYHETKLHGGTNKDLYNAVYKQMDVAKRNIWKSMVERARGWEKNEKLVEAAGRKF